MTQSSFWTALLPRCFLRGIKTYPLTLEVHSLKTSHCQEHVGHNISSRTCWGKLGEIKQDAWEGDLKVRELPFYFTFGSCQSLFSSHTHLTKWKLCLEPSDLHASLSECGCGLPLAVRYSKRIHDLESWKRTGMAQMLHSPAHGLILLKSPLPLHVNDIL